MKLYERVAANMIAKPIIEYLQRKNPGKNYTARYSDNVKNEDMIMTVAVAEKALIFGRKTVCTIDSYLRGRNTVTKSHDNTILPQTELDRIIKGTDPREIILSAAEIELSGRY